MFSKKALTAAVALAAFSTTALAADDTTAKLKGMVNVDGATVTVQYEPTGLTKTRALGDENNFSFSFLPVGGPYVITVSAPGYESVKLDDVFLALYQNSSFNIELQRQGQMEEVSVFGRADANAQGNGTGTTLNRDRMDGTPTVDRSIADFARLDPRITISAASTAVEISAMGVNNRFNDFQIDGVSMNDPFGLNASGFATFRNPVSMDFVDQIAVDLTPYDVSRSSATGATISVVTKSGTNEFDGSIYYTSRDESNVGDLPNGSKFPPFSETITNFTLSGPIIKDKLFFFVGYEEFERTSPFTYGPADSNALNKSDETAATFQQIADIAKTVYGFDPGAYENMSFPETAEEYIVKLDYNINDYHRVSLNMSNKEELNWSNFGLNKFQSVSYTKPPITERLSVDYTGEITENLNIKATYTSYDFKEDAESPGGLFPEVAVKGPNGDTIYLGGEKYRGANYIGVNSDTFHLKADYTMGAHVITAGFETETGNVQNQFLARYNGEVQFDSIDDFANGNWSYLRFNVPTAGLDRLDTITADFDVEKFTYYLQDAWAVNDKLDLQFGVRVDSLKTPTKPVENAAFVAKYGYSNATAFDYSVTQPRFSFNYDMTDMFADSAIESMTLRGGYGLFMGRFPNVWLGNAYSRPGPLSDYRTYRSYTDDIGAMPADAEFFWLNSPASSYTIAPAGSSPASQYVAADFEAPSTYRGNLAVDMTFVDGTELTLEYNQDRVNNALAYRDVGLSQTNTLADGRPVYKTEGSYELTNTGKGEGQSFTVTVNRDFGDSVHLYAAYTNTDSKDVWGMTSSQAESNFGYQPAYDIANPGLNRSAFMVKHNFVAALDYRANFFGDNETRMSLVWSHHSGEPYSVTMNNGSYGIGYAPYGGYDLAYIPTGAGDSNVVFASDAVAADVMAYVEASGLGAYKGTYAPRNALTSPWVTRADLRITQEVKLPTFMEAIGENRAIIYLDVLNLGNLLNKDSGIVKEVSYNTSRAIDISGVDSDGRYLISGVDPDDNFFTN
ncbi:MAG: hypothetical protein RL336_2137, partial [Pseudomonadota bacterium]